MTTALSDEELVAKYRDAGGRPQGTPYADELFQRHYQRVALWCLRVSGDREVAADLAQEVFSKAWAHLDHFRSDSKFTTWLYMIARNHCFNAMKSKGRLREDGVDGEQLEAHPSPFALVDQALVGSERVNLARKLMASELTAIESQVMTLHFAQELPLSAISRLLKMENPSGAKAYIVSAKRKLKAAVDRMARRTETRGRQP
jgi:RNA polymerase sigma factor (sigma-70 family)